MSEGTPTAMYNQFSGGTATTVVQVRDIHGDLIMPGRSLPVPKQLPAAPPYFTDRTGPLSKLDNLLTADTGQARVVVVTGSAAVGKTALALQWAHQVRDRFPGGQLYVDLYGYHRHPPVEMEKVLDGFLRALDMEPERIPTDVDTMIGMYRTYLAGKQILILLDNAGSAEQVRPLLPSDGAGLVMVTSRSMLSGLVVRDGAARVQLAPLAEPDAVALFDRVAGAGLPSDAQVKADLVRRAGYLPLTVLITAEQATTRPYLSLAELLEELTVEGDRLDAFATADHDTEVRNVFSWSYRELAPQDARVFRLLGLHAGPEIAVAPATALCDLPAPAVRRALQTLSGMNLLDEIGRDRFRFHDLIREYALERVIAEEPEQERRACIRRELTWYLHTADAVDRLLAPKRRHVPLEDADVRPLNFDDHEAALNWCEAERPNLLAAVEQAVQIGADDLAWKLPVALIMFFHLRKHRMDRLATTLTALDAARRALDRYGEAWSLICNGGAYADLRRFEEAATAYASAQAICREIGDRQGEGMSLVNAAYALLELDRGAEAIDYAERALPIWREIDDQRNEVITLQALGDASLRQREYTSALAHYHQALPIAHEIDLETEGYLLHGLGGVHQARGAAGEAVDAYARALQVRRRIGDRRGEASSLRGLGQAHRTAGDTETARERLEAALAIFEELDDPDAEAVRADLRSAGGDEFGGQA